MKKGEFATSLTELHQYEITVRCRGSVSIPDADLLAMTYCFNIVG
jgi:hypothetical protein